MHYWHVLYEFPTNLLLYVCLITVKSKRSNVPTSSLQRHRNERRREFKGNAKVFIQSNIVSTELLILSQIWRGLIFNMKGLLKRSLTEKNRLKPSAPGNRETVKHSCFSVPAFSCRAFNAPSLAFLSHNWLCTAFLSDVMTCRNDFFSLWFRECAMFHNWFKNKWELLDVSVRLWKGTYCELSCFPEEFLKMISWKLILF